MVWLIVVVIALASTLFSDTFATATNLANLSRQMVVLSLVAVGQFLVVLTGGIDLSVASVVKLTTIVSAIVMDGSDARAVPAIALALVIGLATGVLNGLVVTRLRVPPFIATLGSLAALEGFALLITSVPKGRVAPILSAFYGLKVGPIFGVVALAVLVWVIVWFALGKTAWGRHVYAVGGNPDVARLSGIRTERVRFSTYVGSGFLAAMGGLVTAIGAGVGDPNAGFGIEFESLAAVVVGGVSLFGGRGRLAGVLGGVLLLGMLRNSFNLVGIPVWYQQAIKGGIILMAAALYVQKRQGRS